MGDNAFLHHKHSSELMICVFHSRSLSAGGAYSDEGIYIERRSTANSSRAGSGGSSSGKGSYDSGTGQDVPEPFRYRVPTKEQLERSGPIPEHIVSRFVTIKTVTVIFLIIVTKEYEECVLDNN